MTAPTKPTRAQLEQLRKTLEWSSGNEFVLDIEALRALLADYRARGEAMRGMLSAAAGEQQHDAYAEMERVLEGAGDEPT